MSTPSERIFAHQEDDDGVELRYFLPAQARQPMTLAQTADRIAAGTALREAVADFVDNLRWARDEDDIARRITERRDTPTCGHVPSWSHLRRSVGEASCSARAC